MFHRRNDQIDSGMLHEWLRWPSSQVAEVAEAGRLEAIDALVRFF